MPPKKKSTGPVVLDPTDPVVVAKQFEIHNDALQRQLADRMERTLAAERMAADMRQRMDAMEGTVSEQQRETFDITAEMTRQYKAMQDNLLAKIMGLEDDVRKLKDELAVSRMQLVELGRERDAALAKKDDEIEVLKRKMEDMASEFGDMLAETLRKMGDKVELAAPSWEVPDLSNSALGLPPTAPGGGV